MKKHSHIIQSLIFLAALTAVVFVACYLFFREIEKKNDQTAAIVNEIQTETDRQNNLQSLNLVLQNSEAERNQLNSFILPNDAFVPYIESLERQAKTIGVAMTDSLDTKPDPSSTSGTEFFLISMNISGTWDKVIQMINIVESAQYASTIDTLELNKNLSDTKKSLWTAGLTLRMLKYK